MRNKTYYVIIPEVTPMSRCDVPDTQGQALVGVQDLGGSQMAPNIQAGKLPANDNCPDGVGAVEKIIPPQW
jgi:hypothetical protein